MVTSEEVIKAICNEVGLKRSFDTTPHIFSKPELKDLLSHIIKLKHENHLYKSITSLKVEVVTELKKYIDEKGIKHE